MTTATISIFILVHKTLKNGLNVRIWLFFKKSLKVEISQSLFNVARAFSDSIYLFLTKLQRPGRNTNIKHTNRNTSNFK